MGTRRSPGLAWTSLLVGFAALLAGSSAHPSEPAPESRDKFCVATLEEGKGQIWLYRTEPKGLGIPPEMEVDGAVYESIHPGTAYHLSVAPGEHVIGLAYVKKKVNVTVEAQRRVFVRFDLDRRLIGGGFYPVVVDEQTAVAELLKHTGTDFTRPCD